MATKKKKKSVSQKVLNQRLTQAIQRAGKQLEKANRVLELSHSPADLTVASLNSLRGRDRLTALGVRDASVETFRANDSADGAASKVTEILNRSAAMSGDEGQPFSPTVAKTLVMVLLEEIDKIMCELSILVRDVRGCVCGESIGEPGRESTTENVGFDSIAGRLRNAQRSGQATIGVLFDVMKTLR